jgi:hypothetical protein
MRLATEHANSEFKLGSNFRLGNDALLLVTARPNLPLSGDDAAGDAISRVARWVRLHVIWLGVYH